MLWKNLLRAFIYQKWQSQTANLIFLHLVFILIYSNAFRVFHVHRPCKVQNKVNKIFGFWKGGKVQWNGSNFFIKENVKQRREQEHWHVWKEYMLLQGLIIISDPIHFFVTRMRYYTCVRFWNWNLRLLCCHSNFNILLKCVWCNCYSSLVHVLVPKVKPFSIVNALRLPARFVKEQLRTAMQYMQHDW